LIVIKRGAGLTIAQGPITGVDHPLVMIRVLKMVFGPRFIPRRQGIPCQIQMTVQGILGIVAGFAIKVFLRGKRRPSGAIVEIAMISTRAATKSFHGVVFIARGVHAWGFIFKKWGGVRETL
jgi:hypothetical protein